MNKRKRSTASKHAHDPKIAAKAQRHAIVRSPKDSPKSSPKHQNSPPESKALLENLATTFEDHNKQTVAHEGFKKGTSFSLAMAHVPAYQSKLLEMAQANMQLAFEYTQRLATIKSPLEFPSVIAEFISKRMAMFRKHSTEMAALSIRP